jgi:hypothetical protein
MSQLTLARNYLRHCTDTQSAAVNQDLDDALYSQALAASNEANAFLNALKSFKPDNFLHTVAHRAVREPHTGICDALLVTPVSLGTRQGPEQEQAKEYLKRFGLVKFLEPTKQSPAPKEKVDAVPSGSHSLSPPSLATSSPGPMSLSPGDKKLLQNPLQISSTKSSATSVLPTPEGLSLLDPNDLLLSAFVVEYKKQNDNVAKALNQERMYLVSLVTFLAALGIKGFAVFGLITSGQTGGIMMAWQSETEDV